MISNYKDLNLLLFFIINLKTSLLNNEWGDLLNDT